MHFCCCTVYTGLKQCTQLPILKKEGEEEGEEREKGEKIYYAEQINNYSMQINKK